MLLWLQLCRLADMQSVNCAASYDSVVVSATTHVKLAVYLTLPALHDVRANRLLCSIVLLNAQSIHASDDLASLGDGWLHLYMISW